MGGDARGCTYTWTLIVLSREHAAISIPPPQPPTLILFVYDATETLLSQRTQSEIGVSAISRFGFAATHAAISRRSCNTATANDGSAADGAHDTAALLAHRQHARCRNCPHRSCRSPATNTVCQGVKKT